jgi:hypothetical protein
MREMSSNDTHSTSVVAYHRELDAPVIFQLNMVVMKLDMDGQS